MQIELHRLPTTVRRAKKRLGRGRGSGRGKTAGRGAKGQAKRSRLGRVKIAAVIRQLPLLRGRGFKGRQHRPTIVKLRDLNRFRKGTTITCEKLREAGLVPRRTPWGVKILASGKLEKALVFSPEIKLSRGAKEAIKAAGGEILTDTD